MHLSIRSLFLLSAHPPLSRPPHTQTPPHPHPHGFSPHLPSSRPLSLYKGCPIICAASPAIHHILTDTREREPLRTSLICEANSKPPVSQQPQQTTLLLALMPERLELPRDFPIQKESSSGSESMRQWCHELGGGGSGMRR